MVLSFRASLGETGMIIPSLKHSPKRLLAHLRVDLVISSFPSCDNVLGHLFEMCMQSPLLEVLRLPRTQRIEGGEHPALVVEMTGICTA